MGLVAHEVIEQIHQTAMGAQIYGDTWRDALFGGIDSAAVGLIGKVQEPTLQLDRDLRWCNEHELADGRFPLVRWITNAARLTQAMGSGKKFAEFLETIRKGSGTVSGRGGPFPEQVDRGPQWTRYRRVRREVPGPVYLFLLPCISQDSPGAFVKRVRLEREAQLAVSGKAGVLDAGLITWDDWDDQDVIRDVYKEKLSDRLRVSPIDGALSFQGALDQYTDVFVEMRIGVDLFGGELVPFLSWLANDFWTGFTAGAQIVVFAHLENSKPAKEWIGGIENQIGIGWLCPVRLLDPLDEVRQEHVGKWVAQVPGVLDPETEARTLLGGARSARMADVIPVLRTWQQKRRTAGANQ